MNNALFCLGLIILGAHISIAQGPLGWMSISTREALARDLVQAWDEQDRALSGLNWKEVKSFNASRQSANFGPGKRRGKNPGRFLLEVFVKEVAENVALGPKCMDWGKTYIQRFSGCKEQYLYKFKNEILTFRHPRKGKKFGAMTGDLGWYSKSYLNSGPKFDLLIVTQVFEHVPNFWKAIKALKLLLNPGGIVLFTVPFAYIFHPFPGDFWRYSPMGILHVFESAGFNVCKLVANGMRTVQMHALGLTLGDIPDIKYLVETRSYFSLLKWSQDYAMIAQLPGAVDGEGRGGRCTIPHFHLTNEIAVEDIRKMADGGYQPPPEPLFP